MALKSVLKNSRIKKEVKNNSIKKQVNNNGVLQDFTRMAVRPTEVSQLDPIANNLRYGALTLNRLLITEMLQEHGLVKRFIKAPIDDAYRGGIEIKCDELSADELKALQQKMEEANDLQTIIEGRLWADAFGGGGLIINCGQELDKPFTLEQMAKDDPLEFYAVDRWELNMVQKGNILDQTQEHDLQMPYNYYGHNIHKTNLLRMLGERPPSMIRGQFSGWGVSKLEGIVRSWNQYLKNQEVSYELTDEAKIDVFRLNGFADTLLSEDGAAKAAARVQMSSQLKNYKNALVLDKEDEYEQKSITFGGLAEMMNENRKGICADLGTPMTKLFGLSAAGFNSGEDDLETWNAKVESEIRAKDKNIVIFVIKARCMQLFGYIPETISFSFNSLRVLTSEQEETIKDKKLDRILRAKDSGLITPQKAVELINAEKLFPIDLDENEASDISEQQFAEQQPLKLAQ